MPASAISMSPFRTPIMRSTTSKATTNNIVPILRAAALEPGRHTPARVSNAVSSAEDDAPFAFTVLRYAMRRRAIRSAARRKPALGDRHDAALLAQVLDV